VLAVDDHDADVGRDFECGADAGDARTDDEDVGEEVREKEPLRHLARDHRPRRLSSGLCATHLEHRCSAAHAARSRPLFARPRRKFLSHHGAHAGKVEAPQERTEWSSLLAYRQTWSFILAKFLTDPVWWFYLEWLPPYLYDVRHFNMKAVGWAIPVVYITAGVGSVAGGWLSGWLIGRG